MLRKLLMVVLLSGAICLAGTTLALGAKYNEAPMLRALVAAGELPPVEERLPDEPKVKKVVEEIGQYGGTLHTFGIQYSTEADDMALSRAHCTFLLDMTMDGEIVPDLAKGYELSDDGRTFTLYLRKGAKWSDGHPFTADDILFMFEDILWVDEIFNWNAYPEVVKVEKIDDYTVRFELNPPTQTIPVKTASWAGTFIYAFAPKHYLKKWHIKYNPNADELAKKEGFKHWWEAFTYHSWFEPTRDINKPRMSAWVPKKYTSTTKVFERNPYFYQVDEAGNQLPYIDRVIISYVDLEGYQMKIISGEADLAIAATSLQNYPLYKEHEEEGGYRVILIPGLNSSEVAFGVNQNHPDPFLGPLFRDIRFRQALSVAINREEINNTFYFGLAVPCQATVLPNASFYKEEWGKAYAQYDPDMANRLLDELGLTERDENGFRLDPSGKPIVLLIEYPAPFADAPVIELVKEYWENIGLKVVIKGLSHGMYDQRVRALNHMIMVHPYQDATEVVTYCGGGRAMPHGLKECPAWHEWLVANDAVRRGDRTLEYYGGKLPGEEPPEEIKQQWERGRRVRQTKFRSKEYMQICQEIYDFQAKNLYAIGTVGMAPQPCIVKKNLRNFPKTTWPDMGKVLDIEQEASQFFWKQ